MANPVISWAKENPVMAGGVAVGLVVIVMLFAGGGSDGGEGDSGGMGSAGVQAYYAAVAQQSQAGAAVQMTQISQQAETNRALIGATYGLETTKVQAAASNYAVGKQADVALKALEVDKYNNAKWAGVEMNRVNQEANYRANSINLANAALGQKNLGGEQRGAIVQAAITGQVVPVSYKPINPGNSASAIIGSIGNAAGNILSAFF